MYKSLFVFCSPLERESITWENVFSNLHTQKIARCTLKLQGLGREHHINNFVNVKLQIFELVLSTMTLFLSARLIF
jgi:hypothetical protein